MFIFCTRDQGLIGNCPPIPDDWGQVHVLNANLSPVGATDALLALLLTLEVNEPLCISAHGNDQEIGDSGNGAADWGWDARTIAEMLAQAGGGNWASIHGPHECSAVLFHVCCQNVANFSARVAVEIKSIWQKQAYSVWSYGYNKPLPFKEPVPPVANLGTDVALQWTNAKG